MAGVFQVFVVNTAGTSFGEAENAVVKNLVWELNGAGSCDITLPTVDPDAALFQAGREVQVWRDGTCIWWGPIVRQQFGVHESVWQCAGLLWYFGRRFMGRADRTNQIANGGFESGETSWTFSGAVTHVVETTIVFDGTKSEKLTGNSVEHNTYATQTYTHTTQYVAGGDALTVDAWVYVPSVGYLGGARANRGLVAIRTSGGNVVDVQTAVIDDDTVKNQWLPFSCVISSVVAGDTIEVRLYPPHGIAYYDDVTVTLMESLSFPSPATDAATIIAAIVDYAQDLYAGFTHGKSNLNIGKSCPATGVRLARTYQFVEHANIGDALREFTDAATCDMHVVHTSTTRTFTTYAPTKGSYQAAQALVIDTNVAGFTWQWDGAEATTSVVVLGPGSTPGRPEGGAVDAAAFGGLTLETVESADTHVTVAQLDARAAEILRVRKKPEVVEVTTYPHSSAIGGLVVGDTVPVDLRHGCCTVNATYRVVRISLDPRTDAATITLNP